VDNGVGQTEFFDGEIDSWLVWGTALTADQVKYLFNEPPQPQVALTFDAGLTANSAGFLPGVSITASIGVTSVPDRWGRPNRAAQIPAGNYLRSAYCVGHSARPAAGADSVLCGRNEGR